MTDHQKQTLDLARSNYGISMIRQTFHSRLYKSRGQDNNRNEITIDENDHNYARDTTRLLVLLDISLYAFLD